MDTRQLRCDDGSLDAGALRSGKRSETGGLRGEPVPVSMPGCIRGKKVVEEVRIDLGQMRPPRSAMLKSRGCDAMTGAGGSFSGRSSESRERNGLGRSDPDRCTPLDKTGRNMRAGEKRTVSDTGQIEFRGVPASVGSALIAANDTMRATDTQRPTMRFSAVKTEEQQAREERRESGSPCGREVWPGGARVASDRTRDISMADHDGQETKYGCERLEKGVGGDSSSG